MKNWDDISFRLLEFYSDDDLFRQIRKYAQQMTLAYLRGTKADGEVYQLRRNQLLGEVQRRGPDMKEKWEKWRARVKYRWEK